ncbi:MULTISPECIES: fluoride efflux transporter CrcB [unclassified Sphingomonas]|uniref:fluoride efflux transporter CrcB n=1 Tax=unclassified Sphingomonas TaxID=196159 RepID=UPI0022B37CD4|nr:fluoride efflux transporter CrcB [Sphingomonas sp. NIBR02145]WHU02681.1 fluoride efflux transporter CrcB [Sphingomonas sp. NIBR02145]
MPPILLVMLGGAFGSAARYLTGKLTLGWFGPDYPWGTLAVNLIGGFLMGMLAGTLAKIGQGGEQWRLLIGVGLLGGYTTFSAFTLDLMNMIERGDYGMGLGYILASVVGSALALFAGLSILRALP